MFVHLREELFAVSVDEAYVGEVDKGGHRCFAGDRALPAFFQFADARPGQSPLNKEANIAGYYSGSDA